MAYVLSSVSGNLISAASAGFAPTNSADVSAIASAYQVVSATATQLYAGSSYVTSVNDAPVSASRAGNAANASMANSAYYDGTGRLISSLPDSAAVSAIASAYAESAASGKLDSTAQVVTSIDYAASMISPDLHVQTLNGYGLVAAEAYTAHTWVGASSKQDTLSFAYDTANQISSINGSALAGQGGGGGSVASPSGTIIVTDGTAIEATNSAIGSSTVEQKFLNYAPNASQVANWQSTVLLQGYSVSGANLMTLLGVTTSYSVTASAVYTAVISGYPIGGGDDLVGSASATSYGSSMEFNFPLDPSWGFGSIWASARYYSINLNTADNNAITFYSADTTSGVKELAWKDDIPTPINIGVYENIYHDKYVSSIDNIPVSAKWAGSANYTYTAYTAEQDPNGRYLSALADKSSIPSGVTSPNGTIIANGFNVEATNSAVTTTVVPGYATTVAGWEYQVSPDTPVVCTLPSANENSKLFFQLDYGGTITASAVYNGTTATATVEGGNTAVAMFDVPNATTVSLYGSWYRVMLGSASASAADYLVPGGVAELAWASALPTYSYDAEDKISAINGSALAGGAGGGVDSATVSAIASSYAESAVSSKADESALSGYYTTANESGFLTGVDLSNYATTTYVDSSISSFVDSAYVESAVSGKADSSALTSYALSADVSGTVDLVGTQSANWGGSALALSAGPGVMLTQSGSTLIASIDNEYIVTTLETVGTYSVGTNDVQVAKTFSKTGYKPIAWEHRFGFATTLDFNEENTVIDSDNQLVYQGYIKNRGTDTKNITFKLHISWAKVGL